MDWLWGTIYRATGGWSPTQRQVNIAAGFGDGVSRVVTFGTWSTSDFRDHYSIGNVDKKSSSYCWSKRVGYVVGATNIAGLVRAAAKKAGWGVARDGAHKGMGPHIHYGPKYPGSNHPRLHFGPKNSNHGSGKFRWIDWLKAGMPWRWK